MKNLLIKQKSDKKLNESMEQSQTGGMIFKGPFTICSTADHKVINRNGRIYMEAEVLRHLGYLREKIKTDGSILGELDHPDGRFDTNLKCVSHKVTDLWYDQAAHVVMGKLQLLDTPNGKIVESLVKSGYPLYVSSRAAGGVDEKTKEVTIDQIFTYDIVCTPGFAEARLDMVNESVSPKAYQYLNESMAMAKMDDNKAKSYGLDEGVTYVKELEHEFVINENDKEFMDRCKFDVSELCRPINESDDEDKNNGVTPQMKQPKQLDNQDAAAAAGLPTLSLDPNDPENQVKEDKDKKEVKEDGNEDAQEKDEKKSQILSIESETEDNEKESKRDLILDIQKEEKADDKKDEESDSKDDDLDVSDADDKDDKDDKESDEDKDEDVKEDSESDAAKEEKEKAKELKKDTKSTLDDIEDLLKQVESNKKEEKKKKDIKESIMAAYPFTVSLSPANFSRFARLNPEDKRKCNDFIVENQIYDVKQINEMWNLVLDNEDRIQQKNWLRLAEQEDIDLYLAADKDTQNAIEETAKYCILETKADVDEFWERQGLRRMKAQQAMSESWASKYNADTLFDSDRHNEPYSDMFIDMISDLMDD